MTFRIYPNVSLGAGAQIGDFVLLGVPPIGRAEGELATVIGENALIRSHSVIYAGNVIGDRFACGHGVLLREESVIGDDVSVGSHSVVEHHVHIGNKARIHSNAFIPEYSELEDECWIGPMVALTNVLHPLCPEAKACARGPRIRRGAKVGANATLCPDIVIGANALVGAGAVVVEDVPDGAVVVGNPARVVAHVRELKCPYDLIGSPYGEGLSG